MKIKILNKKIIKLEAGLPTNYCTISLSEKKLLFHKGFQNI